MKTSLLLLVFTCLVAAGCGGSSSNSKIDELRKNAVSLAFSNDTTNFAEGLKKYPQHVVSPTPWVGHWWAYTEGGIASGYRDPQGISPADKYDQAYREYMKSRGQVVKEENSAATWERWHHTNFAGVESWWGHCNGWAAAALMVPEPREPKTLFGVKFDVRDLKALVTESWLEFSGDFIGTRVQGKGDMGSTAYWDTVPAHFHLVLTGLVGKQNKGVIIDRHTGYEVWNQPLVAYKIDPVKPDDYLGPHPAYPNVHRINVNTSIWWANDNVPADAVSPPFNLGDLQNEYYNAYFPGRKLRYELWLDAPPEFDGQGNLIRSGDIVIAQEDGEFAGGVWKNGVTVDGHPDYMWMPYGVQYSSGYKNPNVDDEWVRNFIR